MQHMNRAEVIGEITHELKESGTNGNYIFEVTTYEFVKDRMYQTPHKIKVVGKAIEQVRLAKLGHKVRVVGPISADNHIVLTEFFDYSFQKTEASEGGEGE